MSTDALTRPFGPDEVKQFRGKGGMLLDYIEDEAVMDRLDEFYGAGNWQVMTEPVQAYPGVVKVRLGVPNGDGSFNWYEDYGYPNNGTSGEALKESLSDGLRRCGRYLGIARDLYRKHDSNGNGHGGATTARPSAAPSSPARGGTAAGGRPRPSAPTVPQQRGRPQPPRCPVHNWAMRDNRTHDGWFCTGKQPSGDWCDQRLTDAEASDLASQASDLDDLPF